jgi:hypothetical protein
MSINGGSCATAGQTGQTGQVALDTAVGTGHTFATFADPTAGATGCGGGPDAQPASANRIAEQPAKRAACDLARAKMWAELVLRQMSGQIASGMGGREIR